VLLLPAEIKYHIHIKLQAKLLFCIFLSLRFEMADEKTKGSEMNGSKRYPNTICS
jgi:hypothetical protein